MKTRIVILGIGIFMFFSCSSRRIDMIEENFNINLPDHYEVIKNITESSGFAGSDFVINVELKFDREEFERLELELKKIDSLRGEDGKYFSKENNELNELEIDEGEKILKYQSVHI